MSRTAFEPCQREKQFTAVLSEPVRSRTKEGEFAVILKEMQTSPDKRCPGCGAFKPLTDFHIDRSKAYGRHHYCKQCQSTRDRERRNVARSDESSSEESAEVTPAGHDLYVMTNTRIPGEYKVGRSKTIEQRREGLQTGQNFTMELVATFPGAGYAEGLVHHWLAPSRVREGPGREWFKASLSDILHAVGRAMD